VLQQDAGSLAHAAESYEAALSVDPGHVEATANLGSAYQALGQNSAAAAAYTTAIHLAQGVADSERASGAGAEREPGAEVEAMLVTLHYALGTVYQRLEVGERPVGDGGEEGGRGDGAARQGVIFTARSQTKKKFIGFRK
jgi:tetratricopeptide (TPR) repeat protein